MIQIMLKYHWKYFWSPIMIKIILNSKKKNDSCCEDQVKKWNENSGFEQEFLSEGDQESCSKETNIYFIRR